MTTMETPRQYQLDMVAAPMTAFFEHGQNRILLRGATGIGKSTVVSYLLREDRFVQWLQQFPETERKTLIIAHREELLDQMAERIRRNNPGLMVMIEQGERRASIYADVIVASIQTLSASDFRRLHRFTSRTTFRLVVVDEAHHAAAATYRTALVHLGFLPPEDATSAKDTEGASEKDVLVMQQALAGWDLRAPKDRLLVGVTATPNRSDAVGLGCVFQTIAYSYGLREAINDKWLVDIVPWAIETRTSLDNVKVQRGDFNQRELAQTVNTPDRNTMGMVAWQEYAKGRPTIGFTVDVAHAHAMAELFVAHGYRAMAVSGETPKDERRTILRQYSDGQIDVLFNCMVLTEGTDLPRTSAILHLKPTKSATLYEQMCLDDETQILTTHGWKGIDDSLDGVQVAAFSMDDGSIHWSDAPRVEYLRGEEVMWGISNPHLDIRVTGGHKMVIQRDRGLPWTLVPAEAVPGEFLVPVSGLQDPVGINDLEDHEVTLLGLLLTDGHINKATNQLSLFQSERYPELVHMFRTTLVECGLKFTERVITKPSNFGARTPLRVWIVSRGKPRGAAKHLRGWGYLGEWIADGKSLTPAFESLSHRQIGLLLNALHAGNGAKRKGVPYVPSTLDICMSPRLADQLQGLLVRRGYRCNQTIRTEHLSMLHVSSSASWSVTRGQRNDGRPVWDRVPSSPTERVWCVTVDTGAIVTRRNGKVAIVGNTGRGLRLYPDKTDCVVIDLVDVARRHSLQAAPSLYGLHPGVLAQGKKLGAVAEALDELLANSPSFNLEESLQGQHMTLEQLGALARRVDPWAVQDLGDFGKGRLLNWVKLSAASFRVQYPWADGVEILEVCKDMVDRWEVSLTLRPQQGQKRQKTLARELPSAEAAAMLAEAFVQQERQSVTRLKAADAPWRSRPVSPRQLAMLKRLGVTSIPPRMTMGMAADCIDVAMSRKGKR